ncbi:hypothetical protein LDENG_00087350 [Lucifuga dentata]|nr:hypothetical protein LDENG_00087350 [Lucifuga dentata]
MSSTCTCGLCSLRRPSRNGERRGSRPSSPSCCRTTAVWTGSAHPASRSASTSWTRTRLGDLASAQKKPSFNC